MNWKKLFAALMAMLLALSVSACSEPEGEGSTTEDAKVDKAPVEVTYETDFDATLAKELDALAESPASDFDRVTQNGSVTVTGYHGTASAVRVPIAIDGAPVTSIADNAFANQTSIETLVIPDSVTHIGQSVLAGCTSLIHLQTPLLGADSTQVQRLGYLFGVSDHENHARDIPASLILLRLGSGVTSLADYALYDCNDLQCVILPKTLEKIGKFAFYNCSSMERLDGLLGVCVIGEYAFADCAKLKALTLGDPLTSIGFSALRGCQKLTALTVPFVGGSREENSYLAYVFGAEYPDFAKGHYPPSLSRVVLLDSCVALGDYAFFECETLKEIVLSKGLKSIGVRAFYGCTALWSVALPDALESIRENAFYGCDNLLSVTFGKSLRSIGINAFYRCDSLSSVVLPASLAALPASCFADCSALETVDLGGVRTVGDQAFRGCVSLKTVKGSADLTFGVGNELAQNRMQ